jgi:hypothetical protein
MTEAGVFFDQFFIFKWHIILWIIVIRALSSVKRQTNRQKEKREPIREKKEKTKNEKLK